jgi:hypothetical protein
MFSKIRQLLASGKPVDDFEAEAAAIRESWRKSGSNPATDPVDSTAIQNLYNPYTSQVAQSVMTGQIVANTAMQQAQRQFQAQALAQAQQYWGYTSTSGIVPHGPPIFDPQWSALYESERAAAAEQREVEWT